ncbi:MAG: NAD(P) transhydrogenase subunit alpha [Saprospirales bacterium]|nr:NAD(P) transhydrogenase subunit alpha [Saprospirales bacterium]MBK6904382.1 NAD(P) transhydrogenase subunit alpha [Saprospirales bacterium]
MILGIPKETNDRRVAFAPATLAKAVKDLGIECWLESGAGLAASFPDGAYSEVAKVVTRAELFQHSDIVVSINPIPESEWKLLKKEAIVISRFESYMKPEVVGKLQEAGLRAFGLDMVPRTTLAQSMDVLSSLASISGYKAVLLATHYFPRYFPMLITPAGSVKPSTVLVLGAGVAGLQAIATAKRLGAIVEASDPRLAVKEEVESLGGKFILVEGAKDDSGAGGYAVEQSEDFLQRQRVEVQARAAKADVIITTAQVRGKKAPMLLPAETVNQMKPGSVIIDLAASTGGNCELTQDGKVISHNGVTIVGNSDLSQELPQDASFLFGNNVLNFMKLFVKKGELAIDESNVIIQQSFITAGVTA